jgi:hypothetical protein
MPRTDNSAVLLMTLQPDVDQGPCVVMFYKVVQAERLWMRDLRHLQATEKRS